MAYSSDWDSIPSPMGAILIPGFDRLRSLTDEELCAEMNTARFVDPASLREATRRTSVVNYYDGRNYLWNTMDGFKAWDAARPKFFDVLLAFVLNGRDPSEV